MYRASGRILGDRITQCGQGLAGIVGSMCPVFGTDISLDAANVEWLYGKAGFFDCGHSLLGNELSGC